MQSIAEAVESRQAEKNSELDAQLARFSIWISNHIAETEETQVESSEWEITVADDGSFIPAFRVNRFSVETEQGWTEIVSEIDEEPEVEEQETGWLNIDIEPEEVEEASIDPGPGFVYATADAQANPTWVIYAWQAYSGKRYRVDTRDNFVDACVCASELGPYR